MNQADILKLTQFAKEAGLDTAMYGDEPVAKFAELVAQHERNNLTSWKPIETAPKDGTNILASDGGSITTVYFYRQGDKNGYWSLIETGAWAEDRDYYPTHWMPLPPEPTK